MQFKDATSYDLPTPYITPVNRTTDGPGYMVSLYHQLHCLVRGVYSDKSLYGMVKLTPSFDSLTLSNISNPDMPALI